MALAVRRLFFPRFIRSLNETDEDGCAGAGPNRLTSEASVPRRRPAKEANLIATHRSVHRCTLFGHRYGRTARRRRRSLLIDACSFIEASLFSRPARIARSNSSGKRESTHEMIARARLAFKVKFDAVRAGKLGRRNTESEKKCETLFFFAETAAESKSTQVLMLVGVTGLFIVRPQLSPGLARLSIAENFCPRAHRPLPFGRGIRTRRPYSRSCFTTKGKHCERALSGSLGLPRSTEFPRLSEDRRRAPTRQNAQQ